MEIAANYAAEVSPQRQEIPDISGKVKKIWINSRAAKETRYAHYLCHKTTSLAEKERWSIDLLKMALSRSKNPCVSCSFGIDSIITVYLTRKALVELGRDPSDIDIVWNDTANEFPDVRKYQKQITRDWNLRLNVTKPEKTLKHIIDANGGITSDYFTSRKGDRRHGKPLSEKCCETLKHKPMRKVIKNSTYDLVIVGLRADESSQRLKAALRDGEYFYSHKEWKSFMCRPILWVTEKDVWDYVEQEEIPYNGLYHNNLIQKYPKDLAGVIAANRDDLLEAGIDVELLADEQIQTVTRQQANILNRLKFTVFTPRTGCMCCPIRVRHGYLHWMRIYYPKVYNAMVYNLGYGKGLIDLIPEDVREELRVLTGIELTVENAHEHLQDVLDAKPCTFDKL